MGRLNLTASNPVKDAIDSYSALNSEFRAQDAAKLAAAKDTRDATTQGLQQQAAQVQLNDHANKQTDQRISAIRMKMETGVPLSPEESATVSQYAPVEQGTPVQAGGAIQIPTDPRAAITAEAQKLAPSPLWVPPKEMTEAQAADRNVLIGTFNKMNEAKAAGKTYTPDLEEYKLLAREVVNNPAMRDGDLATQYKALTGVNSAFEQLRGITQPTQISDPKILDAIHAAFPKIGAGSNLKDARPSKIFVQPSPDGDPMKAKLTIGISGTNEKGEVVDGVVTHNRSSNPDDQVLQMTGGQWITQAQQKLMALDGLKSAQVALGNNTAMPIWEQAQINRQYTQGLINLAGTTKDPAARDELMQIAALVARGMTPDKATALVDRVTKPGRDAAMKIADHTQAVRLKKMDNDSSERNNIRTNETSVANNKATNSTHVKTSQISAAAGEKKQDRADSRNKDARIKGLNDAINAATKQLSSGLKLNPMTGDYIPMDPATKLEVSANLASYRAQLEAEGVKPVAVPATKTETANRPPLSSFKR